MYIMYADIIPLRPLLANAAPEPSNASVFDVQVLIDALPTSALIFQRAPDHGYVCVLANQAFERLANYTRHNSIGLTLPKIRLIGNSAVIGGAISDCFETGSARCVSVDSREDISCQSLECSIAPVQTVDGRVTRVLLSITDRTPERMAERQLMHAASHDNLTGLPNRTLLTERIERSLANAKNNAQRQVALLFLNIDRFKLINESLGHVIGDELLITLARRLIGCVRAGDTLARLGGDEFAILLEDVQSIAPAQETAERIHRELSNPIRIGGEELYVSFSIGAASSFSGEYFAENLIQDADFAMNRAKALGRGCTEIYQNAEHLEARALFRLETDLRHAVWRRELTLNYQPLIDLKTGRPHSFEALARWHHPSRGFVSPAEFIPVAESTGLIVELGRWALDEACRTLAQWRSDGVAPDDLRIAVNVSALQFARGDLAAVVLNTLERYDLPGRCLELEITESAIAEHPQKAVAVLNQLKAQDVIIAMDDFGTGYSSLGALQQLPIDVLKIDRSFIAGMLELEDSHKLVCTVLSLASHMGKTTVAEGIERFEQAVALRDLGCTLGQGYAFSRPVDSAHAVEFLRRTTREAITF